MNIELTALELRLIIASLRNNKSAAFKDAQAKLIDRLSLMDAATLKA